MKVNYLTQRNKETGCLQLLLLKIWNTADFIHISFLHEWYLWIYSAPQICYTYLENSAQYLEAPHKWLGPKL
jgi:hypothetical protein